MTTHTDLIARLREMAGRLRLEAADALEALEQQVAALTNERDELKISNAFAHGEWRAVKDQLAAAQAREAKLRDAAKAVLEVGMGSDFEALNAAFAIPADDSALMERLKKEREQLIDDWTTTIATCYKSDDLLTAEQVVDLLCSSNKKADAIRSMT